MILRQIGSNQTELSLTNGNSIFFSYETPVAGYHSEDGFFKTETYYSKTTSRHINQYFKDVDDNDIIKVPDQYIVDLVNFDVKKHAKLQRIHRLLPILLWGRRYLSREQAN